MENQKKTSDQIGCGYCRHEKTCKDRISKNNKAKDNLAKDCINFIHHELTDLMGSHPYFKSKNEAHTTNYGYKKVESQIITLRKYEVITCECGKECPVELSHINDDGNWICSTCQTEYLQKLLLEDINDNKENLNFALSFLDKNDIDYNSATEKVWMEALKIAAGFE